MIGAVHTGKRDKGRGITPGKQGSLMPGLLIFLHRKTSSYVVSVFLPVFAYVLTWTAFCITCLASCTASLPEEVHCEVCLTTKATPFTEGSLDLFFFNDDDEKRLDSYQRIGKASAKVHGASRTGSKTVVAIANLQEERYTWSDINSLNSLRKMKAFLDEDSPSAPVMSGTTRIDAGKELSCRMELSPVMSEVVLRSLRCDFSGRSYSREELRDVKVYLTNVCSAWPVMKDTLNKSGDYINIGRADSTVLTRLSHPEYIYRKIDSYIGSAQVRPDIHFYCYPNVNQEESLGSPYTRLVIEGTLAGQRYYYPLNVNRRNGSPGIERNTVYILDVVLTRRGTMDPDTAVDSATAMVTVTVEDWNEKEKQYVSY